jgi:DedD protein
MGLFSRKESESARQSPQRRRPSVSSEAQAASLRVRARRRLAGAVALVLAAVIVLPMLLEGEPRPIPAGIEIVVPERQSAFNPDLIVAPQSEIPIAEDQAAIESGDVPESVPQAEAPSVTDPVATGSSPAAPTAPTAPTATPPTAAQAPAATPAAPAEQSAREPAQTQDTTDLAMAILEGRATPQPAQADSGNYVVQVASYGTDADAQARRDKLRSEGVSNAFVQAATVNGKQTFRLRVGPFDSRAAAQAAQARLRTLGYDAGFITAK